MKKNGTFLIVSTSFFKQVRLFQCSNLSFWQAWENYVKNG